MKNGIKCAVAEIKFFVDYADPKAPVLSLGVIAEAAFDGGPLLVMVGRTRAPSGEIEAVKGFNRVQLESLQKTLSSCFEEAVQIRTALAETGQNATPGQILRELAERHTYALHVDPPRIETIPAAGIVGNAEPQKALRSKMIEWLEAHFRSPQKVDTPYLQAA